jgi:hypothetical protein
MCSSSLQSSLAEGVLMDRLPGSVPPSNCRRDHVVGSAVVYRGRCGDNTHNKTRTARGTCAGRVAPIWQPHTARTRTYTPTVTRESDTRFTGGRMPKTGTPSGGESVTGSD